jgi:hypothetical protein
MGAASTLTEGLDQEKNDEMKLLRVRTRKHELVIVPGMSGSVSEHNITGGANRV